MSESCLECSVSLILEAESNGTAGQPPRQSIKHKHLSGRQVMRVRRNTAENTRAHSVWFECGFVLNLNSGILDNPVELRHL